MLLPSLTPAHAAPASGGPRPKGQNPRPVVVGGGVAVSPSVPSLSLFDGVVYRGGKSTTPPPPRQTPVLGQGPPAREAGLRKTFIYEGGASGCAASSVLS
jgi:hypothetical protein